MRALVWVMVIFAVGVVVTDVLLYWQEERRNRVRNPIVEDIHRQIGFRDATPYVKGREVILLVQVTPNKPFAQAGIQQGDQMDPSVFPTLDCIYTDILSAQGHSLRIPVIRSWRHLVFTIQVPKIKLRADPSSIS